MHLRAWVAWIASLLAVALSTRNPLYLVILLLVALTVSSHFAQLRNRPTPAWLARFAVFVIPISALFNALTIHIGDTVLLVIPGEIPLLSGPITLEAVAYGGINGLVVMTMISVFSALSAAVPAQQLVRATPRAFQSIGVTVGLALSFIPQTLRRLREVREAQAVRGHQVKGLRDWLPLWLPLLMGGLEQSMQLSEAMVARGFGAAHNRTAPARTRLLLLAGLTGVLAGFVLSLTAAHPGLSLTSLAAGGACILLGLRWAGDAAPHTTYRLTPFTRLDALCAGVSTALGLVILLPVPLIARETLHYTPYPRFSIPSFDPALGILMLGWLTPLLRRELHQEA